MFKLGTLFFYHRSIVLSSFRPAVHLNTGFVDFLLEHIETTLPNDETDQVPDMFVKLLLAFNLHFEMPSDNIVMEALAARGTAKDFTEKLMLLINREGTSLLQPMLTRMQSISSSTVSFNKAYSSVLRYIVQLFRFSKI